MLSECLCPSVDAPNPTTPLRVETPPETKTLASLELGAPKDKPRSTPRLSCAGINGSVFQ